MAGIVNAANSFALSSHAELRKMYDSSFGFSRIKDGTCGPYAAYFASDDWSFCTGLGSPKGYAGK